MIINDVIYYFYFYKRPAKYDYDQEPSAPSATGGLVKPSAASASVYSRPRTPPKIRRPVPLSAQDKFAYKTSVIQPTVGNIIILLCFLARRVYYFTTVSQFFQSSVHWVMYVTLNKHIEI